MELLHLDKEIAVLLKSPGELSEGTGADALPVRLATLLAARGEDTEVFPVHRLDRGTGGLIVYARTRTAAAALSTAIATGRMEKEYLAVTEGVPAEERGRLTDFLFFDRRRDKSFVVDRMRKGVKEAVLSYERLATVKAEGGERALLRVRLETGRTHQIRVQFASRRLPLCGDRRYGAETGGFPALFASYLAFPHPRTGKCFSIGALPSPEGAFAPFADTLSAPMPLFDQNV